jgi:hypothetical protein
MLERGLIPPNALFETPNPDLDNEFYNVRVGSPVTVTGTLRDELPLITI